MKWGPLQVAVSCGSVVTTSIHRAILGGICRLSQRAEHVVLSALLARAGPARPVAGSQ